MMRLTKDAAALEEELLHVHVGSSALGIPLHEIIA